MSPTIANLLDDVTEAERMAYESRRYVARRLARGVYVQVANDGEALFAIAHLADGAHHGLEPERFPELFDYWSWGRIDRAEWDRWVALGDPERLTDFVKDCAFGCGRYLRSKRDAIGAALEAHTKQHSEASPNQFKGGE